MMIANNDEEKRSQLWRIVTTTTTIIIILIAAFFMTKLFTGNPLAGDWESVDADVTLTIRNGNRMTVEWDDIFDTGDVKVEMTYTLDKDAKTIQIKTDEKSIDKAVEKSSGKIKKQQLDAVAEEFVMTFDYSMEQNELILTEREYGEQMVFIKDE